MNERAFKAEKSGKKVNISPEVVILNGPYRVPCFSVGKSFLNTLK